MAGKLTLVAAALAVMVSYGMSAQLAEAADRKTCVAKCKKSGALSSREMPRCVQNCMAAN